ncbi:protein Mon2p [Monosporozyma servazzii]
MRISQTSMIPFATLHKQLDTELHNLASESKRRNSQVKQACDKSLKILKTVHNNHELTRHPDFVLPFILACSSRNAKLTSIAIQCLQLLSSMECIPKERLSEVLDGFIEATHLATDIQLKILQVVPIFFKTYARYIHDTLVTKLLQCCSNLFQLANKSVMVTSAASAAMQQLVDEIFERLSYDWSKIIDLTDPHGAHSIDELEEFQDKYSVLVNNNDLVKVNANRYDANRVFANLISLMDISTHHSQPDTGEKILNLKEMPMDYGLEILESILKNNKAAFIEYPDLQFLLRIKAIPLLLRCITNPKDFSVAVRSYRCIKLLLRKEYLCILELELEVILSLLIHVLTTDSKSPSWGRVLSLELFNDVSNDFELIEKIYLMYDNSTEKKSIISTLLLECIQILRSDNFWSILGHSENIEKMDMPIISNESSVAKTPFIQLLDKTHAPSINITYITWLILSLTNKFSEELSELALKTSSKNSEKEMKVNQDTVIVYEGMFESLYELNSMFLYATSVDNHLFHNLVRSFQKLAHGAGVLLLLPKLNKCLDVFSKSIVNNVHVEHSTETIEESPAEKDKDKTSEDNDENEVEKTVSSTNKPSERQQLHSRIFNSRHVSLFRALVSLSISLGANFDKTSWKHIFLTWQWVSYYIYGPSIDFMESYYSQDVPIAPILSKNDISTIEVGILKLFENTSAYPLASFKSLLQSLIESSDSTMSNTINYHPIDASGKIVSCVYNKGFYITQIGEIASYNTTRFLANNKGKDCWDMIVSYFIKLIADRNVSSISLRQYIARVFNDIIKGATEEVGTIEDTDVRSSKFSSLETLIISAIMNCIAGLSASTSTKDDIYQGVITTDAEILFQLLSTVKGILNEFGDMLTTSWLVIFQIINAPFHFWSKKITLIKSEDDEDSSLLLALNQRRMEMIQASYDVFKLISDDFLQTLPLETIKYVIDTLINYVNQDMNLNISFSSISQFWLISDYLRVQFKEEFRNKISGNFEDRVNSGDLMEIITSKETSLVDFYNGLWIYLLESLIECSKDERLEVKNGAIQTFFRIIDSHSNYLPSWKLIYSVVLKPLLTIEHLDGKFANYIDFYDIAISGLVTLYPIHFGTFDSEDAQINTDAWITFYNALQKLFHSQSTGIKFVAISNYKRVLQTILELSNVPDEILNKSHELWIDYNIVYSDSTEEKNVNSKSEYDCVYELISTFPFVYQLATRYNKLSFEFVENSLSLFNAASRYPLLPPYSKDNVKPSTLQASVLDGLKEFDNQQSNEVEILILLQLSSMSTLMFDTREKIMTKLAPKLSKTNLTRIPTFEAISYRASSVLCERLNYIENIDTPSSKEKLILKILKNLVDLIIKKPLVCLSQDDDTPMWVLASNSLIKLSTRLLVPEIQSSFSPSFRLEFQSLFINACCVPIKRISSEIDAKTEESDILRYNSFKDLLLKKEVIHLMEKDILVNFISTVWDASFSYQLDEIENEFISQSNDLETIIKGLSTVEFSQIFGSTVESQFSTKIKCAQLCLNDLIKFLLLSEDEYELLRNLTAPFLTLRIVLVLRKYIADESLIGRAPIPKARRIELLTLLKGLCKILDVIIDSKDEKKYTMEIENILHLYPLILKTIPVAHKVNELQEIVLQVSLRFAKLDSLSKDST